MIQASDQALPIPATEVAQVTVSVKRDTSLPKFHRQEYSYTINEDQLVNSTVADVLVRDNDKAGKLVFKIEEVYPALSFFRVDIVQEGEAKVVVNKPLKEESLQLTSYKIIFKVYDSSYPNNLEEVDFIINVRRNINGPRFNPSAYRKEILDKQRLGEPLLTISANDPDGDIVKYRPLNETSSDWQYFFLDEANGTLMVRKSLQGIERDFSLPVQAYDPRGRTANGMISVIVKLDNTPPIFDEVVIPKPVSENSVNGSDIIEVQVNDPDRKGDIKFEIIGFDPAQKYFAVEPISNTGRAKIRIVKDLKTDPLKLLSYSVSSFSLSL